MSRFAKATGNCGNAKRPPIARLLKHGPNYVALTEAENGINHIRRVAGEYGYDVRHLGDIVLVVKSGALVHAQVAPMDAYWWWGPSRWRLRRRAPREHADIVVLTDAGKVRDRLAHFPPGGPQGGLWRTGGKNKGAWHESKRKAKRQMRKWTDRKPGQPRAITGDLNATEAEIKLHVANMPRTHVAMAGKVGGTVFAGAAHVGTRKVRSNRRGHGWGIMEFETKG